MLAHSLLFLFFLFFAQELPAQFFQTDSFKKAHIGISIVDIETEKEIYSSNGDQFFVPASLQKIPLSAAAVALLGEEYHFNTVLEYEGKITQDGHLQGNVWIRGGGDPTLSLDIFAEWEEAIKREGIHKIDGKIYVDASCFESSLASPYWQFGDLGNYYGAGASGLTINQNLYRVTFQPGKKEGDPATVLKIDPPVPQLQIHNEVSTGPAGSGDQVCIYGVEYSPVQFYRGTVPIDQPTFTVKGAIPDPASFCANNLSLKIEALRGIEVTRETSSVSKKVLWQNQSGPLKEILKEINHRSLNLYAEHLFKAIGRGKAKEGAIKMEQFLKDLGVPAQVKDGSGLSRTNYLTPKGFTTLLCKIKKTALFHSVYESFLELNTGETLIKAKTGSMSGIYNLGGYLTMPSGKEIAFCIMCNNYPGPIGEIKKEIPLFLNNLKSL